MIESSAAAPPLLLQLVLQQQTKLTGIDVVVATKEGLKMKKKLFRRESSDEITCRRRRCSGGRVAMKSCAGEEAVQEGE
jgi:hypothetical protein